MSSKAQQLIRRSHKQNQLVVEKWDSDLANELLVASEENVDRGDGTIEFWGQIDDDDVDGWRVHLTGAPRKARPTTRILGGRIVKL